MKEPHLCTIHVIGPSAQSGIRLSSFHSACVCKMSRCRDDVDTIDKAPLGARVVVVRDCEDSHDSGTGVLLLRPYGQPGHKNFSGAAGIGGVDLLSPCCS